MWKAIRRVALAVVLVVLWGSRVPPVTSLHSPSAFAAGPRLANAGRKGLAVKTIDEMLQLPEEEMDVGMGALLISKEYDPRIVIRDRLDQLDEMAQAIRKKIRGETDPRKIVETINHYLFKVRRYTYTSRGVDSLFLHTLLEKKTGRSGPFCALYLSIAERIGLPLCGVRSRKGHFVRYVGRKTTFNIDPAEDGAIVSDAEFLRSRKIPDVGAADSRYMTSIGKQAFLLTRLNGLRWALWKEHCHAESLRVARKILALDPGYPHALYSIADRHRARKRYDAAINTFEKAIAASPCYAPAWNGLARVYYEQGRYEEALGAGRKALAVDPDNRYSRSWVAWSCCNLGRHKESIEACEKLIELDPDYSSPWCCPGQIYREQEQYEQAIEHCEKAVSLDFKYRYAWENLILSHLEKGDCETAWQTVQEARRLGVWVRPDVLKRLRAEGAEMCVSTMPSSAPLANHGRKGLEAKTVEAVLKLPAEEMDIGRAALLVEKEYEPDLDVEEYLAQLDTMAREIRALIGQEEDTQKIIAIVNAYLLNKRGYRYFNEDAKARFLHCVLDRGKGNCQGLSTLYLSIAERIGLPAYGVLVPAHAFVRCVAGEERTNIDPAARGFEYPDARYVRSHRVPRQTGGKGVFLRDLDKRQYVALQLTAVGAAYNAEGNRYKAIGVFSRSLGVEPGHAWVWGYVAAIYRKQGKPDQALAAGKEYLAAYPNHPIAWETLARTYWKQKEFDKAINVAKRSVAIHWTAKEAWDTLGRAYAKRKDFEKAIPCYKKAIAIAPEYEHAWTNLAKANRELGKNGDTVKRCMEAIAADPDIVEPWWPIGWVHCTEGRFDAAFKAYDQALKVGLKTKETWQRIGWAHAKAGDFEKSVAAYKKATEIDSEFTDAWSGLAWVLLEFREYHAAIDLCRQALALNENHVRTLVYKGYAYGKLGLYTEGILAGKKAAKIDPENKYAWGNLGWMYRERGAWGKAIRCCKKSIALDPKRWYSWEHLVKACEKRSRLEELITFCKDTMKQDAGLVPPWRALGWTRIQLKRYADGIKAYRKATEMAPKESAVWHDLGWAYYSAKKYDDAVEAYKKALKISNKRADSWCGLGDACHKLNWMTEAIDAYKKSLDLEPGDASAWPSLERIYLTLGDRENAIAAVRKRLEFDPDDPDGWKTLARLSLKERQLLGAATAYGRAFCIQCGGLYTQYRGTAFALGWFLGLPALCICLLVRARRRKQRRPVVGTGLLVLGLLVFVGGCALGFAALWQEDVLACPITVSALFYPAAIAAFTGWRLRRRKPSAPDSADEKRPSPRNDAT